MKKWFWGNYLWILPVLFIITQLFSQYDWIGDGGMDWDNFFTQIVAMPVLAISMALASFIFYWKGYGSLKDRFIGILYFLMFIWGIVLPLLLLIGAILTNL